MARYMFWMLLASSFGFIKLIGLAFAIDATNYGQYVAIFGLSTLSGAIGSFGLVERTIKQYPRQWIEGARLKILVDAKTVLRRLLVRFALFGAAGTIISTTGMVPYDWIEVACILLLGLGSACVALFASLYRAASSRKALQDFSLWRSGVTCMLALIGGWYFGWAGALGGDILALVFIGSYSVIGLRRLYAGLPIKVHLPDQNEGESGHGSLYVANMLTASTSMADRALIGSALGASSAGSYGVIMLLPQVCQMLVNVVSQYVGPLVIKFVHSRHLDKSRISALALQGWVLALVAAFFVVGGLIGKHLPFVDDLFTKFSISDVSIIIAGMIGAGQIYSLIEFHLIANDGERYVLAASAFSAALFFLLFATAAYQTLAVEYFVGIAAIVRWLQVSILSFSLMKIKTRL
jgi:hypothetical protein